MENVKAKASTSFIALAKELGLRRKGSRSLMSKQALRGKLRCTTNPPSRPATHLGPQVREWKAYVGVPFPSVKQPPQHIDLCYPGTT
jgi:hypothetical protein